MKIGHGGTLDPLATGVLIAGVGRGTKSLHDFLLCTKEYEAVVLFGTSTDTYDRNGKVLKRAPYEHITKDAVEKALDQFRGKFKQMPPLYSALKMNGKPLYEYAREGKEIPRDIEKRDVEVLQLEMVEWMEGGTHNHVAPTDEAGHAEVNVANRLWAIGDVMPSGDDIGGDAQESFESKKRKLSEKHDDLVSEMPASKQKKLVPKSQDAVMSGGLLEPELTTKFTPATQEPTEDTQKPEPPVEAATVPSTAAEQTRESLNNDIKDVLNGVPVPTGEQPTAGDTPKPKGPPAVRLRMTVTSGFYVRSLCHDLGVTLKSAALMAELERTRQADFVVGKNCLEYSDLQAGEKVWGPKVEAYLDLWEEKTRPRDVDEIKGDSKEATKEPPEEESKEVAKSEESKTEETSKAQEVLATEENGTVAPSA